MSYSWPILPLLLCIVVYICNLSSIFQERIRIGRELLEAKRMEEENERKRLSCSLIIVLFIFIFSYLDHSDGMFCFTLTASWLCGRQRKRRKKELGKRFVKNWKKTRFGVHYSHL